MSVQPVKEFRLKGGQAILDYIRRFSATEKAIFGLFAIAAGLTALLMANQVNNLFTVEVPTSGGTLREGLIGLPHTINPVLAVTDADRDLTSLVYAGLTKYSHGELVPDLASGWTVSSDGLTYSFTLRPNLKFQNGAPLTAADVLFTIEKVQDRALKSPQAADWVGITATSSSPLNVTFILKQPYNAFLTNTTLGILPKAIWGNVSDDQFIFSEYNISPIGAGPYRVAGIDRDQGGIPIDYRLTAWDGRKDVRPLISELDFYFYPDLDHALSALNSGNIDSLPSVPPAAAAALVSNTGELYTAVTAPLSRIFGVFFNQNVNPILADSKVRQALSMAIDRRAIVETVLLGYGVPINSPLPVGMLNTSATSTAAAVPAADINGAASLLEQDGWQKGADGIYTKKFSKTSTKTLSLSIYTADAPDLKQAADMVANAWTKLGVDVSVKVFEPSDLYQNVIRTRQYDALLFGEAIGKDDDLYAFWHSSERNAPGLNVAMYANTRADRLLENIRAATSSEDRTDLESQFEKEIATDVPAVFLYSPDFIYAVPRSLHGLELRDMTQAGDRFADITDWYIETEKVWKLFTH